MSESKCKLQLVDDHGPQGSISVTSSANASIRGDQRYGWVIKDGRRRVVGQGTFSSDHELYSTEDALNEFLVDLVRPESEYAPVVQDWVERNRELIISTDLRLFFPEAKGLGYT